MHIGVFGDSFAARLSPAEIWWRLLEGYGHTVQCFGESGSSLVYSAELIDQHAKEFELVIWCVTTPGRFSVLVKNKYIHFHHLGKSADDDYESSVVRQAVDDYRKYLLNWSTENFVGKAVISYLESRHKNIMLIPCFPPPIFTYPDKIGFNLYDVSQREAQHYFPGKTLAEITLKYDDLRPGHLTPANNKVLAEKINRNLRPGIFQTKYELFGTPNDPIESVFKLR